MPTKFRKPVSRKISADMGLMGGVGEFVVTIYKDGIGIRRKSSRTEYKVPLSFIFQKGAELMAVKPLPRLEKKPRLILGLANRATAHNRKDGNDETSAGRNHALPFRSRLDAQRRSDLSGEDAGMVF